MRLSSIRLSAEGEKRCSFCGRMAVYHRRYTGDFLCDRCLCKSVEKRFLRAIREYRLIEPGERIAVAVSGGKDSVTCLHLIKRFAERKRCEVVAITVDEGISGYREAGVEVAKENARSLDVELFVVSFRDSFGLTLDEILRQASEKGKSLGPCTYCGVLRRSLLNRTAKEVEADKLATAHNLDDEVQAIMLNYIRSDIYRLYRLGPILKPMKGFVPRIKPMREIPEKEIAIYALLKGFKVYWGKCPYRKGIHVEVEDFLNRLEENHPNSKFMILRMYEKIRPYLEQAVGEFEMKFCKICGEPSPSEVCKKCELLRELQG
ncbi:MAG: TIGR00269 family protein [Candidatus Hadarchaeales archaeon]